MIYILLAKLSNTATPALSFKNPNLEIFCEGWVVILIFILLLWIVYTIGNAKNFEALVKVLPEILKKDKDDKS